MLNHNDVEQLSVLARVSVSPEEVEGLTKDLDAVLGYVSEISSVATGEDVVPRVGELRNIMREDDRVYSGGEFTPAILKNAPRIEDNYVKVKQIL